MKKETAVFMPKKMMTFYKLTLQFVGRVCASVPADPNVLKTWLKNRQPNIKPPGAKSPDEMLESILNRIPDMDAENKEIAQRTLMVFERFDKAYLCVRSNTIRAHLKDCARQVQKNFIGRDNDEQGMVNRFINCVYPEIELRDEIGEGIILFMWEGKPIEKNNGISEKLVHVQTSRGPINAIKHFEYLLRPSLSCTLQVFGHTIRQSHLEWVLKYGGIHGYGGERSMMDGQYTYT